MGEIDACGQRRITARAGVSSGNSNSVRMPGYLPCGTGINDSIFNEQTQIRVLAAHRTRGFPNRLTLGSQRAQGMPGARCTRGSRVQYSREVRTRAYRAAESIRHSLRNGFTTYSALSLVIGFLATIAPEKPASQELDASTEASGPHAFVVRVSRARHSRRSRPPQPVPRSRRWPTPLFPGRDGNQYAPDLSSGKAKYF
jgi:hypothetical protein